MTFRELLRHALAHHLRRIADRLDPPHRVVTFEIDDATIRQLWEHQQRIAEIAQTN